jgi:hypothetical protein
VSLPRILGHHRPGVPLGRAAASGRPRSGTAGTVSGGHYGHDMVRHLTMDLLAADYQARPDVDDRDVTSLIPAAVGEVLATAETWLAWDGA